MIHISYGKIYINVPISINSAFKSYDVDNLCFLITNLPPTSNFIRKMPLHLPRLHLRSRSHSTSYRTDLCRAYTMTSEERRAQGYLTRSDWTWHNGLLLDLIQNALKESTTLTWHEWTVQSECRKIRQTKFEDLDLVDQVTCVAYRNAFLQLKECLRPYASSEQLAPIEEVVERLQSFTQQAEQLYGVYEFTEILLGKLLGGEVFICGDKVICCYASVRELSAGDSERVREA